jgi:hypothetical protein
MNSPALALAAFTPLTEDKTSDDGVRTGPDDVVGGHPAAVASRLLVLPMSADEHIYQPQHEDLLRLRAFAGKWAGHDGFIDKSPPFPAKTGRYFLELLTKPEARTPVTTCCSIVASRTTRRRLTGPAWPRAVGAVQLSGLALSDDPRHHRPRHLWISARWLRCCPTCAGHLARFNCDQLARLDIHPVTAARCQVVHRQDIDGVDLDIGSYQPC